MRKTILTGLAAVGLALMLTDSVLACRFLDNLFGRCGPRRCTVACEPVGCIPACCAPTCCQPAVERPTLAPMSDPAPTRTTAPPVSSVQRAEMPAVHEVETKPIELPAPPKRETKKVVVPAMPEDEAKPVEPQRSGVPVQLPTSLPKNKPSGGKKSNAGFEDPFSTSVAEEDMLRIWTDATGTYRVEARLVDKTETTVRLERADGRMVRIDLARLSAADQRRVRELPLEVVSR